MRAVFALGSVKPRVMTPQSSVNSRKIDLKRAQNSAKTIQKAGHESRFCTTKCDLTAAQFDRDLLACEGLSFFECAKSLILCIKHHINEIMHFVHKTSYKCTKSLILYN